MFYRVNNLSKQPDFLKKPLAEMTTDEWESICDGCALCCQVSEEDEDTGELTLTNISCKYLCLNSHQCGDYKNRQVNVPSCIKITPENIDEIYFMPASCGYRLVAAGHPLPDWHHLICGDKQRVHTDGPSMKGALISETEVED